MLTLTVKLGGEVVIDHAGERILVRVCQQGRGEVRLSFHADRETVRIMRREVLDRLDLASARHVERGVGRQGSAADPAKCQA